MSSIELRIVHIIYIAMADLMPTLHRYAPLEAARQQLPMMMAGFGTSAFFQLFGSG